MRGLDGYVEGTRFNTTDAGSWWRGRRLCRSGAGSELRGRVTVRVPVAAGACIRRDIELLQVHARRFKPLAQFWHLTFQHLLHGVVRNEYLSVDLIATCREPNLHATEFGRVKPYVELGRTRTFEDVRLRHKGVRDLGSGGRRRCHAGGADWCWG